MTEEKEAGGGGFQAEFFRKYKNIIYTSGAIIFLALSGWFYYTNEEKMMAYMFVYIKFKPRSYK